VDNDDLLIWNSTALQTLPVPYRQINNGVPGILIALAWCWKAFGRERHRDSLIRGARWLAASRALPGAKLSGLYAGEAGVGAALLWAASALRDKSFVDAAYECERRLRVYPFAAPDLFHGTAGRLRFLLMLWLHDHDTDVLSHALSCAEHLHLGARMTCEGQKCWCVSGSDTGQLTVASYAHGSAGIADALLDLYEITNDSQHLMLAMQSARWVRSQAVVTLPGSAGLDWGNGSAFSGLWCYGASGVGALYLHLARLGAMEGALETAKRAGTCAAWAGRNAGPGLCHGLAGSIEYLLDLYQHTADPTWLSQAWQLEQLLDSYWRATPAGYPSAAEDEGDISYMLGDAGIAVTLLRLSEEGRAARPLSLEAARQFWAGDEPNRPAPIGWSGSFLSS
jgi:lantibiotic modifying enzyme